MPIIKTNKIEKTEKIKLSIDSNMLTEIKEYCKWTSVEYIEVFFEQAAKFVLKKDTEWRKYKKDKK